MRTLVASQALHLLASVLVGCMAGAGWFLLAIWIGGEAPVR